MFTIMKVASIQILHLLIDIIIVIQIQLQVCIQFAWVNQSKNHGKKKYKDLG